MPVVAPKPLESYKRDAARLLKAVRGGDTSAQTRFSALENPPVDLQLKHALAVIAQEAGFESWTTLKHSIEGVDFSELFASPGLKDSINHWFATYAEAKTHQTAHGGVLLPYRHQCFVTSLEILSRRGFEKDDADWADIGHDFVEPGSADAHARIKAKLTRRFAGKA